MPQIVIDTSIYRQDLYRKSAAWGALARLVRLGVIGIHVPFFVHREFASQLESTFSKTLKDLESALKGFQKTVIPDSIRNLTNEFLESLVAQRDELLRAQVDDFHEWIRSVNGEIHPIREDHAVRVANDYFSGVEPFKTPKNRNDIPDSFIWHTIVDLRTRYAEEGDLYVIVADKALQSACVNLAIVSFESLSEFIESDPIQQLLLSATAAENWQSLLALLPIQEQRFINAIAELTDGFMVIEGKSIVSHHIPDDSYEATIWGASSDAQIEINFNEISYYGAGEVTIPFSAKMDAETYFYVYKADYYILPDETIKRIGISDWNDHFWSAEAEYPIIVEGQLKVTIQNIDWKAEQLTRDQLEQALNDSSLSLEPNITIEFNEDEFERNLR